MGHTLTDDLREQIAARQCVAIVGAGVSIYSTDGHPCASWTGLLHDGVQRCVSVRSDLPPNWSRRVHEDIASPDIDDLLAGAEKVAQKLGAPRGGEYSRWLRESAGALRAKNTQVLMALRDLGMTIVTTNYDNLLEEVIGLPAVTWMDGTRVERVLRGDESGIVHLHGHWQRPESVILGVRSYEKVVESEHAQAMLRAMSVLRSIVFVGCGDGLKDPNFGALLKWTGSVFAGSEYRRFCLARNGEANRLQQEHPVEQRLFVIGYGDSFDDLAPFLQEMCHLTTAMVLGVQKTTLPSPFLPPRQRCFGRNDELGCIVAVLLAASPDPVPVLGPPGIGKTNLALAAANDPRVAARFGTRRTFIRCDGLRSRADLSGAIASALGLTLSTDNEGALLTELVRAPGLMILDNAETPWENDTLGVEELLARIANIPGLALVVTMRGLERPAGLSWCEPCLPKPLSHAAARELFLSAAGRQFVADAHLDRLLSAVDKVPLAITLLASLAEAEPDLEDLWSRWDRERTAMLERAGGRSRLTNVELSYELSWSGSRMTAQARRMLQLLAWLPVGLAHDDLEAVLPGEGTKAAAVLRKAGLAFDEASRIRVLAPLREFVRRRYPPETIDLQRTAAHFVSLAGTLGWKVGGSGGAVAVTRLGLEAPNIEVMFQASVEDLQLVRAATGWAEFLRLAGVHSIGVVERAAEVAKALGDFPGQAKCIEGLADICFARSDHESARARYEDALLLYRRLNDPVGQANCICMLGDIALSHSDYHSARVRYDEALPLYRRGNNLVGEANCTCRLGDIANDRLEHDAALTRYGEALTLYRKVSNVLGQANCTRKLGDVSRARSDYDGARVHYDDALTLFRQTGSFLGQANCFRGLGDISVAKSDFEGALAQYDEAMPLYCRVGDALGEGFCHFGRARVHMARGQRREAVVALRAALSCFSRFGDPYSTGAAHLLLAQACDEPDRTDHLQMSREVWRTLDPRVLTGLAASDGIDLRIVEETAATSGVGTGPASQC